MEEGSPTQNINTLKKALGFGNFEMHPWDYSKFSESPLAPEK